MKFLNKLDTIGIYIWGVGIGIELLSIYWYELFPIGLIIAVLGSLLYLFSNDEI